MCKQNETTTTHPVDQTEAEPNSTLVVTNKDLYSHNSPSNAWCAVHGRVLAISEFSKRHPGGDAILLAAGKDATVLFETYHPRGVPKHLLDKLQVGIMKENELKSSFYSWDSEFYRTLKHRVVERLKEKKLPRRGGYEIWIKAMMILTSFWFSLYKMYTTTESNGQPFYVACIWSVLMGIAATFVGVCIQHDGNHGAFACNRFLNKFAGWTLDMIGASAFTWELQHMLGHHPYTNLLDEREDSNREKGVDCPIEDKDQESDPDVFSSFPAMRMHPSHKVSWYHKYQHLYGPLLFAFMTISKVIHQDFLIIFERKLYHIDAACRYDSVFNVVRFWFMKVVTAGYMIVLPCYFHQSIVKGLTLFFIGHFTCGEFLATMFIVNHVIEGVAFAKKNHGSHPTITATTTNRQATTTKEKVDCNNDKKPTTVTGTTPMEKTQADVMCQDKTVPVIPLNDWAAVQCQTSVNWSSGSWFWNHFSGGLSHQIEHHLFPSVCHTNYVHIQDVVQSTCQEYGVPYQSESNLLTAYIKMMKHLKYMGKEKNI